MWLVEFAEKFAPSIQVRRVRKIAFVVMTSPTRKDTVRAQVNEPRSRRSADLREAMREERIDLQARNVFLSRGALLDDANGIDDCLGPDCRNRVYDILQLPNVDTVAGHAGTEKSVALVRILISAKGDKYLVSLTPGAQELVAKHPIAAENEDSHAAFFSCRPIKVRSSRSRQRTRPK